MSEQHEIARQNFYTIASPEHYDTLERYTDNDIFKDRLKSLLPSDWTCRRSGVWTHCGFPGAHRVSQGFKIHVSSNPDSSLVVIDAIAPICFNKRIEFKIAAGPMLLQLLNSKLQSRASSGKFFTIYPPTESAFRETIHAVYLALTERNVVGPYILSDKAYLDSKVVFYRYGGFFPAMKLAIDGGRLDFLEAPDGSLTRDLRVPVFQLPYWVKDPFESEGSSRKVSAEAIGADPIVLKGRYQVIAALSFSNAGGIYRALDTHTGNSVILKEARPYTNYWMVGQSCFDACHLAYREFRILTRLNDLGFLPEPVDLFQEGTHWFMAETEIAGVPLQSYFAREDVIVGPYMRVPERVEKFSSLFKRIFLKLIDIVTCIHSRGVILGDIAPSNVMIDPDTGNLFLIDVESAVLDDDSEDQLAYAAQWGTPGYKSAERTYRRHLTLADDYYAIGITMFSAITPATALLEQLPEVVEKFLSRMVTLGLPREVKQSVIMMRDGNLRGAISALESISDRGASDGDIFGENREAR